VSVRVVVVHPRDLAEPTSGGIQTFLHDFVAHSPADFDISMAGVTSDVSARPIGKWSDIPVGDRGARFMPFGVAGSLLRRPLTLPRTAGALWTLRSELQRPGSILQLHRPYRHFLFNGHKGPRVQIIHLDLDAWPGPSGWQRLNWLYREFDKDLDRFDRVFVANQAGAERLRLEQPDVAQRIEFLSGWYDSELFSPPPDGDRPRLRAAIAQRLSLTGDAEAERWVLFVGRLDPIKDPELAVDAFAALAADGESRGVRLIVCGDGEYLERMRARAAETGTAERTSFIGEQPRATVAELMQAADVLLVSSIAEGGGPRVVLEALGSGLPVVSTVAGEVRSSVTTQVNGWLAEDRSPASLADGLRWTLAQQRDAMSAAAAAAARPFVASTVLRQLYDAYRDLASKSGSPRGSPSGS
jgi:glycosyltransferase involved in cell wall biosynthesis